MTREAKEVLERALTLSDDERAELAGTLLSSLDSIEDPDSDLAWQQEIVRRAAEVKDGRAKTVLWNDVQQKARKLIHGQ